MIQPTTTIGEWALPTILAHGTEEQREAFVGPTLRGDIYWCQLFSEPGAGSDLASLRTRAEKVDGGWRLNGQKVWTSQAASRPTGRSAWRGPTPTAPKHKGLSYFLVDMRSPDSRSGRCARPTAATCSTRSSSTTSSCPTAGWSASPATAGGWPAPRSGTSASTSPPGWAGGASSQPTTSARCPAPAPGTLRQAGALTADINAFGALRQRSCCGRSAGLQPGAEASVLKVASAWNDTSLRRAVMDWHGAEAAAHDGAGGEASQQYLSIPSILIGGGTLEIQLNVIGELVLGMPRS